MDERTGLGKMVYPDGAEYGGLWRNGVLVEVLDSLDFSEVTTTASPTTMSDVTETDVTTATTSQTLEDDHVEHDDDEEEEDQVGLVVDSYSLEYDT